MKLVRAGLRHVVDNRALVAPVLRGVVVGDDLDFLNLILIVHEHRGAGNVQVVVVGAVDLKVVRAGAVAVDGESRAVGVRAAAVVRDDARREQRQRVEAAARGVRGQLLDPSPVYCGRDLRLLALHDLLGVGDDRDRLGHVARFERDGERVDDAGLDHHARVAAALEALGLDRHGVGAWEQPGELERALAGGRGRLGHGAGALVLRRHGRADDDAAVGVYDRTSERARRGLGHRGNGGEGQDNERPRRKQGEQSSLPMPVHSIPS